MLPSSPFPRNTASVGTIQLIFHLFLVFCWNVLTFLSWFSKVVGVALSIFQMPVLWIRNYFFRILP